MSDIAFRRAGVLRRHRRPGLQEDLPGAAGDGQARPPQRAGHRRGQGRLEPRPAARARAATASRSTAASIAAAFAKLCGLLRYVDGDYNDPATFEALRKELGDAQHPAHYLAIPPTLFGPVVEQLAQVGLRERRARHRREAVRPRPRLGARAEPRSCSALSTKRASSASTTTSASGRCTTCSSSASPTRSSSRSGTATTSRACRSRWPRTSASRAAARSTTQTGAIRDVVQNHLFQVLSNLAMEPPARTDSESLRDEKVQGPEGDPAARRRGRRARPVPRLPRGAGVAPDSQVETFAALRLAIDSWRWQGVPFYIRAGKCLPVTCTEVVVRLRQPPTVFPTAAPLPNYFRFRISPAT